MREGQRERENERIFFFLMFPSSTDYSVRLGQEGRAGGGGDRSDGNGSPSLIQRGPAGRVVSQPIKGLGGKRER